MRSGTRSRLAKGCSMRGNRPGEHSASSRKRTWTDIGSKLQITKANDGVAPAVQTAGPLIRVMWIRFDISGLWHMRRAASSVVILHCSQALRVWPLASIPCQLPTAPNAGPSRRGGRKRKMSISQTVPIGLRSDPNQTATIAADRSPAGRAAHRGQSFCCIDGRFSRSTTTHSPPISRRPLQGRHSGPDDACFFDIELMPRWLPRPSAACSSARWCSVRCRICSGGAPSSPSRSAVVFAGDVGDGVPVGASGPRHQPVRRRSGNWCRDFARSTRLFVELTPKDRRGAFALSQFIHFLSYPVVAFLAICSCRQQTFG